MTTFLRAAQQKVYIYADNNVNYIGLKNYINLTSSLGEIQL